MAYETKRIGSFPKRNEIRTLVYLELNVVIILHGKAAVPSLA